MDKKGKGMGALVLLLSFFAILILGGMFGMILYFGSQQQTIISQPPGTPPSVSVTNPSDTVSIRFLTPDKLRQDAGESLVYNATTAKFVITTSAGTSTSPSVAVAASSSGGTKTGIAINANVKYYLVNTTTSYLVEGDTIADMSKDITVPVVFFGVPTLKVWSISDGAYQGGTSPSGNKTVGASNLSLTAGGASKSYDLMMQIDDPYKQFGDTGIIIGCSQVTTTKYTVGTEMTPVPTLPDRLVEQDKKLAWRATVNKAQTSDGLIKIGRLTFALNSGQTGANINCTAYDEARFVKVDDKTVNIGVNDDTTSNADIGVADANYWFPV